MKGLLVALMLIFFATRASAEERVDLNQASLSELETLPGVGPKRAEAIVAFRDHRPFRRAQELLRIKGIGPKLFARLKPLVIAGDSAPGHAASASEGMSR